ncbi:MYDGF factor, partial [Ifrita kowaldi]|nr:MYDGF factor [Ifrita kowaldi]
MAAPSGRSGRRSWAALVPAALLCLAARAAAEPGTAPGAAPSTAEFDGDYGCTFTYSAQGGTNEQWQMNVGVSEDNALFSCSIWRPQGKSYLFFTQFKAEVKGAKIEYAMAYSQAAVGAQSDIPLKQEEFEITETTVSHREGKFRFELSKLMIVAKTPRDEL